VWYLGVRKRRGKGWIEEDEEFGLYLEECGRKGWGVFLWVYGMAVWDRDTGRGGEYILWISHGYHVMISSNDNTNFEMLYLSPILALRTEPQELQIGGGILAERHSSVSFFQRKRNKKKCLTDFQVSPILWCES